jgi:hypothetical protein
MVMRTALSLVLLSLLPLAASAKSKLAVMELEDQTRSLDATVISSLTDALRTSLASSGRFIVIDKTRQAAALKKLVASQKRESYKACYDSRCQIPLGQALAADSILRTRLTRVGSFYLLNVELVDLEKEAVTSAAQARAYAQPRAGRDDRLLAAISAAARQLAGGGAAEGSAPVLPPPVDAGAERVQPSPHDGAFGATREETPEQRAARVAQAAELAERQRQASIELQARAQQRAVDDYARRRRSTYLVYGWIGIITGGLVAASGIYYLTAKVGQEREAADQATSSSEVDAAAERAKSARTTGIAVTAIGGVAVGVGALLVALAPKLPKPAAPAGGVALDRLPSAGPATARGSSFALSWGGRF